VDYLEKAARGLAGGAPWFCDFGPELSRGFRALKTWFLFVEHGADAIGAAVRRSCENARYLAKLVRAERMLELLAPVPLNIVCFRVRPLPGEDGDELNRELVADLQERGLAAPSTTRVGGKLAIRCCLINHRTTRNDVEFLIKATKELATTRRAER
jgi:glutamate/tyrosine decarboxylase-like PLP-dependent enzyme